MRLALVDLSKVRECRENSFWISLRKSFLSSYVMDVACYLENCPDLYWKDASAATRVKARRLCSARGAKVLPVSVLISKLLVLLCCRDLMLYDKSLCFNHRQKLLDFGEVKISYISFFDIKKHETVNSRWDLELGQEQMRLVKRPSTGNYFSQAPFPHLCQRFVPIKNKLRCASF
ncbi:unnamed protein product [Brassica napus]|uniref:(rape) hypothetical protein n=1 Tax=Brassica napus TaxID=3708 RepID=A0A816Z3B5_BRANA|nr:unnamed protein product [Brassica napus]